MAARTIQLNLSWSIGDRIDGGGFGRVHTASSPDFEGEAVAKFVPKAPGAERELLFVDLGDARNVVPVVDSGEDGDDYVLVMPRADKSLRKHLEGSEQLGESEAVGVLNDIAVALEDLESRLVHRDLKPENVLLLNGRWCLADFGISRYAEATTAPDTQKFAWTAQYAAPEQWRFEHATAATDIYAFGVIAYEMLAGVRPFAGPGREDYRNQHLHERPARLQAVSVPMAALVTECLQKQPESRPKAEEVVRRLEAAGGSPQRGGLARLQHAHEAEVSRRASEQAEAAAASSVQERRQGLFGDALTSFEIIADALHEALVAAAPSIAHLQRTAQYRWGLKLGDAELRLGEPIRLEAEDVERRFDIIAYTDLAVVTGRGSHGYRGRSHSLWYCDLEEANRFAWYEMAFMERLTGGSGSVAPMALDPPTAAVAFSNVMGTKQLARTPRRLATDELDEFVERWGTWFAEAYEGVLQHPMRLPEEDVRKNFR